MILGKNFFEKKFFPNPFPKALYYIDQQSECKTLVTEILSADRIFDIPKSAPNSIKPFV